ncbi:permease prefix domain 1-containing protein [Paractinoplanes hotanensis]|uniref:Permease prefix domain 1-containing protein n=1 Tax=Paractinoplanes hotanensis TaxID=2906497 RepID=A0ABT0Y587_9ACTN|nr:permease prefix domain 1-containing protein [Actinoplanes hotanensis]MCM4081209.1 permease prefix domain 1-containing protein [Actinoplanes hotanensis]
MAGHGLNPTTGSRTLVAAYLDDLGTKLPGPRRHRSQILIELRDGLDVATEVHLAAGMTAERAQAAAVAQFGSPQEVADAFAGELTTTYARRVVATYIATGPLVGIWWLLLLRPDPWQTGPIAMIAAIPALPLIAIAIAVAGGALATTGRLMRWLPETSPQGAAAATIAVAGVSVAADLTMIGLLAASATASALLAIMAVATSVSRIVCSTAVLYRATRMSRRRSAA